MTETPKFLSFRILDHLNERPQSENFEKTRKSSQTSKREEIIKLFTNNPRMQELHREIWNSVTQCYNIVDKGNMVHSEICIYARGDEWSLESNLRTEPKSQTESFEDESAKELVEKKILENPKNTE